MSKPRVYLETSIVSYLASRRNSNLVVSACQQVTHKWWKNRRSNFDLFTSSIVVAESRAGDISAAERRLHILEGLAELTVSDSAKMISEALIEGGAVPEKAQLDALHIAVATVHHMDFMLTWNCRHINNPITKPLVRRLCNKYGYLCPEICTPFELMEVEPDVKRNT